MFRLHHSLVRTVVALALLLAGLAFVPWSVAPAHGSEPADWTRVGKPVLASGIPRVGAVLNAGLGMWAPTPQRVTYSWYRDGVRVEIGQSYLVRPEDDGHTLTLEVVASRDGLPDRTSESAPIPVADHEVLYEPSTRVIGEPFPGQVLDANPGEWVTRDGATVPDLRFEYQWSRSRPNQFPTDEEIPGATSRTYTPTTDDLGWSVYVMFVPVRAGYFAYPYTSHAGVISEKVENVLPPTVTGDARVGSVLTGRPGSWLPATESEFFRLSFQWLRNGQAIPGATALTYQLTDADEGTAVAMSVKGQAYGYYPHNQTVSSAPTSPVLGRPIVQQPPAPPSQAGPVASVVRLTGISVARGVAKLKVKVTPSRAARVTILDGSKVVRRGVRLKNGAVTVTLKRLRKGRHTFRVKYPAQPGVTAGSARVTVRVR